MNKFHRWLQQLTNSDGQEWKGGSRQFGRLGAAALLPIAVGNSFIFEEMLYSLLFSCTLFWALRMLAGVNILIDKAVGSEIW